MGFIAREIPAKKLAIFFAPIKCRRNMHEHQYRIMTFGLFCYDFARRSVLNIFIIRMLWLGAESNRRHVDFQSTALPTELPSPDGADRGAPWGFHYAAM